MALKFKHLSPKLKKTWRQHCHIIVWEFFTNPFYKLQHKICTISPGLVWDGRWRWKNSKVIYQVFSIRHPNFQKRIKKQIALSQRLLFHNILDHRKSPSGLGCIWLFFVLNTRNAGQSKQTFCRSRDINEITFKSTTQCLFSGASIFKRSNLLSQKVSTNFERQFKISIYPLITCFNDCIHLYG